MSEMENNKINEEQLDNVAGGNDGRGEDDPKGGECNGYIFKAYTELD